MDDKLVAVPESNLTGIANAIRTKRNTTEKIKVSDMATQIEQIESGGGGEDHSVDGFIERTLTEIYNDSVKQIGNYAFYSFQSLSAVSFPNVTYVRNNAFAYCQSLVSIYFPKLVSTSAGAFSMCIRIHSIDLPNITSIASSTFFGCDGLITINLPKNYYVMGSAFANCNGLKKANIPYARSIASYAFSGCTRMEDIYINRYSSVCSIGNSNAFRSTPFAGYTTYAQPGHIFVHPDYVDAYKGHSVWRYFASYISGLAYNESQDLL